MSKNKLNIVDDNDNIIGVEEREIIHAKSLLHREVHVYFVTPEKQIIFQHRAKDKDLFPDLLDATVGGHVEIGDSYEESAIKETFEETGVIIKASDLILVGKFCIKLEDKVNKKNNHAFQQEYLYVYNGDIKDLKIEEGKGLGFEDWSIEKLLNIDDLEIKKFIPYIYKFTSTTLIDFINNNISKI